VLIACLFLIPTGTTELTASQLYLLVLCKKKVFGSFSKGGV